MTGDDELRGLLQAVLEQARTLAASRAREGGHPLSLFDERTYVRRSLDNSWSTSRSQVEVSGAHSTQLRLERLFDADATDELLRLGERLLARFSSNLPFWSAFAFAVDLATWRSQPSDWEQAPERWVVERMVLSAARLYLHELRTLAEADPVLAERLIGEVFEVGEGTTFRLETTIVVSGVQTEELRVDRFAIRPLDGWELGVLADDIYGRLTDARLPKQRTLYELPTHAIVVTSLHPRDAQPIEAGAYRSLVVAFALHGYELSGVPSVVNRLQPSIITFGVESSGAPIARGLSQRRPLTCDDFEMICRTADRIDGSAVASPNSTDSLALHRFALGCARDEQADALLDYVIALEALLLPHDRDARRGDLGYRFRLHGALHLADDAEARRDVMKQLRDLYDLRSRLVHGGKYPSLADVHVASGQARQLAAQGLLRAVERGFPSADDFLRMALNEPVANRDGTQDKQPEH